jgi:hypothetical protein
MPESMKQEITQVQLRAPKSIPKNILGIRYITLTIDLNLRKMSTKEKK